jgi:hypothetical protein
MISGVLPKTSDIAGIADRHSKLEMTGWYTKQMPETVRAAVEKTAADRYNEHPDTARRSSPSDLKYDRVS